MKRYAVVLVGAIVLGASAASGQAPDFTPEQRADGEALVRTAAKGLADNLKDPASAKFRNVFLEKTIGRDGKEHVSLCGEVNAKNGYGGMSGWHSFMPLADKVYVGGAGEIINADEICDNGRGVKDTRDYTPELRVEFDKQQGG